MAGHGRLLGSPLGCLLLSAAFALRTTNHKGPEIAAEKSNLYTDVNITLQVQIPWSSLFTRPYRQRMLNFWDLQYAAEIEVGGQNLRAVLDSGSFDLLAFSKHCASCGGARAYDEKTSKDARRGQRVRTQHYGSGSCTSVDVKDEVVIGEARVHYQDMWVAQSCQMPLLSSASFHAIVGLGPPGHMARMARKKLWQQHQLEEDYVKSGLKVPYSITDALDRANEDLRDSARKLELLDSLGTRTFSACYGGRPGAPGWIVWNDATREGYAGVRKIPIAGQLTWGVKIDGLSLVNGRGDRSAVSCREGCGAIVDTGTSLIGVPSFMYDRVIDALGLDETGGIRCDNLESMPRLELTLNGQNFSLPPTAYLGRMYGTMNQESAGFMRQRGYGGCSLLLMDLGHQKTQFGPMFILGIPFMREYYTTFDLGKGPQDRSLWVSEANDECQPGQPWLAGYRRPMQPLELDASKIRMPEYARGGEDVML